uniref:SCP domain-containing protein n=1 Tax=Haemonchus placei TaxID=6290 RepID=A0A0N4XBV6_HAEPC
LKWSNEWANKALDYLKSPKSVKADVVIEGEQSFNEDDTQLPLQKLLAFLQPRFHKIEKDLARLPKGTIYGCNGVINKKGNKNSISAVCLYKKP